ncbi:putative polyketide synthase [Nemania sp. FL0916]|nr:putative polyketide synthase [Nemania sp. FL0916]
MEGVSLLFGTVTDAHNADTIGDLRVLLDNKSHLEWIRETVSGLPGYWDLLVEKIPAIDGSYEGRQMLVDFDRWLRHGFSPEEESVVLRNTVIIPLVVIVGLAEFWQHVESRNPGCEDPLQAFHTQLRADKESRAESIGLCAGMLTAYAVASSHTRRDFEEYGAVAIRLAMMIGVATDAQDAWHEPAKLYVAAWRTPEQGEQLKKSISLVYPEAYFAVLYDERRVTITTTAQWIRSSILRQLQGAGLTVAESNIQGRIHSPHTQSKEIADSICELCVTPALQFPAISDLALPTYTNDGHGQPVSQGNLHDVAVRSTLATECKWHSSFSALGFSHADSRQAVISFGPERCVPPSMVPALGERWTHVSELKNMVTGLTPRAPKKPQQQQASAGEVSRDPRNTIAIVGMSIKTAGADDVDEFSRMIQSGASQHELAGPERVKFHTLFREGDWDPSYKWYANWMRDVDCYDHQFFKRSPREAASMDPQQRLSMQAAYQAVSMAGYYARDQKPGAEEREDKTNSNHVGVYVGITLDDYQNNVRTHRANAFSITGNMRSLIAGKIAHHFGWTGPAMTTDTACSSSGVAIHTACQALLAGDCNAALAGGANVITDPLAFQDLAAANFLSPTGQCKPFDDNADGYCRGEAVGFVFLKRLSDALADGNQIFGCIDASAFYQNENHTPIFVPNSPSLSNLFGDVLKKAEVRPSEISVVECHGTGTPVGDPAEWESVRHVLDVGAPRAQPVFIGSAKGHVGHTEASSGVVALVKVLTMMQCESIPPQASHSRLNHLIQASDTLQIAAGRKPWEATSKVALINNYGASGSNVAMVVSEYPNSRLPTDEIMVNKATAFPFCIAGRTVNSVKAYCTRILGFLNANPNISLTDLAFNMHRQFNRSLPYRITLTCRSLDDLKAALSQATTTSSSPRADTQITAVQPDRPVVLCFGGQVSRAVGLDRNLYDRTQILRYYLGECDNKIQQLGLDSIYPDIFSQDDVQDQQHLQIMLFAMQYACAMCWMQSGVSKQVAAVVGHSFGELTAMCVSGVLSLHDALKLVAGRAKLVRDLWGSDPGVMLAVEAEEETVHTLVSSANEVYTGSHPATIACYNGPRTFTLAGSEEAIATVSGLIAEKFPTVRSKKLRVTNAFHSSLVNPLEQQLESLGGEITFRKPRIPLERTTEDRYALELLGPSYAAEQMRKPVFFHHAVQRLARDYPGCVWLEAGSSSTVTIMAQRSLESAPKKSHHFQALKLNDPQAFDNLSDATVSLWKEGVSSTFWAHNATQTHEYAPLLLPPYQFEKDRHWVELRSPVERIEEIKQAVRLENPVPSVIPDVDRNQRWKFMGFRDSSANGKKQPYFHINTSAQDFQDLVSNHVVANTTGICSGMLQVNLAVTALFSIHPDWVANGFCASIHDIANYAPVCFDSSRVLCIEFEALEKGFWEWKIVGLPDGAPRTLHTTGRLQVRDPSDNTYQTEFRRLGRLVDYERCSDLLNVDSNNGDVEVLKERSVYRMFRNVVDFGKQYRSVRCLVGRSTENAGRITRTEENDTWYEQIRGEHISQVGGIWVNCMTDHSPSDIFVGTFIEMSMVSPDWANRPLPMQCDLLARHSLNQETGDYTTDTFVFDPTSKDLIEVLLGVRYTKTSSASFARLLQRMTTSQPTETISLGSPKTAQSPSIPAKLSQPTIQLPETVPTQPPSTKSRPSRDLIKEMTDVVAELVGIDGSDIGTDDILADFGIDSLLGLELQAEIKKAFDCAPDELGILSAATIKDLVKCLPIATEADLSPDEDSSASQNSDSEWSNESPNSTSAPSVAGDALWSTSDILKSFSGIKKRGDDMIKEFGLDNFDGVVIPDSNRLCIALIVEAFEELGCSLRSAQNGESLDPVPFEPQHNIFMSYILNFLQKTVGLITVENNGQLTRTKAPISPASSQDILAELVDKYTDHADFLRLTYLAGINLAKALKGETDGNRVLMGDPEGRKLCQSVYHNYVVNRIGFQTMRDVLDRLRGLVSTTDGPLRVLELGGGTGSATSVLVPLLASWDVAVEYTFTDLSPSLVAQARRTLGKKYPFMKFAVQDIEKAPSDELAGQQHIIIASHCVHATRSLTDSTRNIRKALRPEGFLMMFEMREAWPALDIPFGLYEGWWLFEDGRTHAYTQPEVWQRSLTEAGYGAVDWTDGELPEHKYYMVLVALASAV